MRSIAGGETRGEIVAERALRRAAEPGPHLLRERAALAYTDAMTRDIAVPDDVFEALRAHFNERQIVELSVLIGLYNMHTRVFTALGIDPEPHHK